MPESFSIDTEQRQQSLDVTDAVREIVRRSGVREGLCHVMVLHSTAALIVNESDDPNIGTDVIEALSRAVPEHAGWLHDRVDDNAHAHIKASLLGPSELLAVRGRAGARDLAAADPAGVRRPAEAPGFGAAAQRGAARLSARLPPRRWKACSPALRMRSARKALCRPNSQ